ncbi:MAG: hypothetical protein KGL41_02310 [Actinomycetales bacterium]|nr:hypothetical protein [Actinomycetales bacterium]
MEITLPDDSIDPFVETLPWGVVRLLAHGGLDLTEYFNNQNELPADVANGILDLWFDPKVERHFDLRDGYVLTSHAD